MTVFGGQENYAQAMIDEFKQAGVSPKDVFAQSFNKNDILYWINHEPQFGRQAVYLDDIDPTVSPPLPRIPLEELRDLRRAGVRIIAPPIFALLAVDANDRIVPSQYALDSRERYAGGPAGAYQSVVCPASAALPTPTPCNSRNT